MNEVKGAVKKEKGSHHYLNKPPMVPESINRKFQKESYKLFNQKMAIPLDVVCALFFEYDLSGISERLKKEPFSIYLPTTKKANLNLFKYLISFRRDELNYIDKPKDIEKLAKSMGLDTNSNDVARICSNLQEQSVYKANNANESDTDIANKLNLKADIIKQFRIENFYLVNGNTFNGGNFYLYCRFCLGEDLNRLATVFKENNAPPVNAALPFDETRKLNYCNFLVNFRRDVLHYTDDPKDIDNLAKSMGLNIESNEVAQICSNAQKHPEGVKDLHHMQNDKKVEIENSKNSIVKIVEGSLDSCSIKDLFNNVYQQINSFDKDWKKRDLFFQFKAYLAHSCLPHNTILSSQFAALMDLSYRSGTASSDLIDFLLSPVEWTKKNGHGPRAFDDEQTIKKYVDEAVLIWKYSKTDAVNYINSQKTSWRTKCDNLHFNNNLSHIKTTLKDFIQINKNCILEKNLTTKISSSKIFNFKKNEYYQFGDFSIYNKDTNFITFEHARNRKNYFGDVVHPNTLELNSSEVAPWKFTIFMENKDLKKAWDKLIPVLFSSESPVESGKVSKPENNLSQVVLYTFSDKLDLNAWNKLINDIEKTLMLNFIQPLSVERKNELIDYSDRYVSPENAQFTHYTLEKFRVRESIIGREGIKSLTITDELSVKIAEDPDTGYCYISESDYLKLPSQLKSNPFGYESPFSNLKIIAN